MKSAILFSSVGVMAATNQFVSKSIAGNMVLQQNSEASLYGFSRVASSTVSVNFKNTIYSTTASSTEASDGGYYWKLSLPPTVGGHQQYALNITSNAGEHAHLTNVVFGDVFFCSGQSNMQFGVPEMFNATEEIQDADNYPNIRLMSIYQDWCMPQAVEPLDDLYTLVEKWSEGSSKVVDISWEVSGLCWMYGKHLYNDIIKEAYPVGLVISDWGGTPVASWAPKTVYDKCMTADDTDIAEAAIKNPDLQPRPSGLKDCGFDPYQPASLYNTMVAPLKDMAFKAGLWYQGETDSWTTSYYPCMQDGMVNSWRSLWGEDFSFMYTQLSTWNAGGSNLLADFRMMQESILDITPKTAMITAADLGDPESTQGDIHPRNKTELGRRMSLAASSLMYGVTVPHMGPRVQSTEVVPDAQLGYLVQLTFTTESSVGLHLEAPQKCPETSAALEMGCGQVLLVLDAAQSVVADVKITASNKAELVPHTPLSKAPIQISYCQGDYPLLTIYNGVGVPLLPFVREL